MSISGVGASTSSATTARRRTTASSRPQAQAARSSRLLNVGSSGPAVDALKSALRAQHYWVDSGSTYTAATKDAVMAFQKLNGLDRDGIAGPRTLSAIKHPRRPKLGSGEANRVVIDLSDQTLFLIKNNKISKIVNTSTGNPNLSDGKGIATPKGSFRVYTKHPGIDPGPLGNLYWSSYFNGGVAVHGSPSVPGYPASHGCARVPMWLDEQLYGKMPVGMQVKVRS